MAQSAAGKLFFPYERATRSRFPFPTFNRSHGCSGVTRAEHVTITTTSVAMKVATATARTGTPVYRREQSTSAAANDHTPRRGRGAAIDMHSVRMSRRKRALTNCAAEHGSRVSVYRRHVPHIDRRGDFLVFFFYYYIRPKHSYALRMGTRNYSNVCESYT